MLDPTGLAPITGLARIGCGRDTKDCAFATIYGDVESKSVELLISEEMETGGRLRAPAVEFV